MAKWMSINVTRGLDRCLRFRRLAKTLTFPQAETTIRTLYVAMETTWPSLNVMSMGNCSSVTNCSVSLSLGGCVKVSLEHIMVGHAPK